MVQLRQFFIVVTQSVFVVVYGHFGPAKIFPFYFLVFPCLGLLWCLTFLRLLSSPPPFYFGAPHSCGFSFPIFLHFSHPLSPFCIVLLLHLSLVLPLPALFISYFSTCVQFLSLVSWFIFSQVLVATSSSSNLIVSFTSPRTNHRPHSPLYNKVCDCCRAFFDLLTLDSETQVWTHDARCVTWYCRDRVSSCNIYAVQQDTQSFLMSEFIHHVC